MSGAAIALPATPTLEPAARAFADATSKQPFIRVITTRYDGTIPVFKMLNPLSGTQVTRGAIAQAISTRRGALFEG